MSNAISQSSGYNPSLYVNTQANEAAAPAVKKAETAEVKSAAPATGSAEVKAAASDSFAVADGKNQLVTPERSQGVGGAFASGSAGLVQGAGHTSLPPAALLQLGTQAGRLLDIDKNMSLSAYNSCVTAKLSSQSGYYMQAQKQAGESIAKIDQHIAFLQNAEPADEAQIEQLGQLKEVFGGISNMYGHLMEAKGKSEPAMSDQAAQLLSDISGIYTAMAGLDPRLVGEQAYNTMRDSLSDMVQLASAYTISYSGEAGAKDCLGVFVVKTFRRLQQIENGQRKRENETPDINGALQTYVNGSKDHQIFMRRFAAIREKAIAGGNTDSGEIMASLKEAAKGTSSRFQESLEHLAGSYSALADAEIHFKEAKTQAQAAGVALKNAEKEFVLAEENLMKADMAVNSGIAAISLPKGEINTRELAAKARDTAEELTAIAGEHIEKYGEYREQGTIAAEKAVLEGLAARASLEYADGCMRVLECSPQGKYMSPEIAKVDAHIAKRDAELTATENDAVATLEQFSVLDGYVSDLMAGSKDIKEALSGLDIDISVDAMLEESIKLGTKGVDAAYSRILGTVLGSGVKVSDDLRQYLKDPAAFLAKNPEEAGNVREEMEDLFADHPELTNQVAGAINSLRNDFAVARREAEATLIKNGKDPKSDPYALMLDGMENSLLDGLFAKNEHLFAAMFASGTESSAVKGTIDWVQGLQKSMTQHTVTDAGLRQKAIDSFNNMLNGNENLKASLDKRIKEYGQPISTECFAITSAGGLPNGTVNVYVFKKDGEFKALDPITGDVYSGKSKDEALAKLARKVEWSEGEISYLDSAGKMKNVEMHLPSKALEVGADIGMGVVGLVGGILCFVPVPVAAQAAGTACIAASASYFIAKGAYNIGEQVSRENFDLSREESRQALIDLASGVLSFAGGVGSAAKLTSTAGGITIKGTTMLNNANKVQRFVRITNIGSRVGSASNVGYAVVDTGFQVGDIVGNNELSTTEKAKQIGVILQNLQVNLAGAVVDML